VVLHPAQEVRRKHDVELLPGDYDMILDF